MGDNSDGKKMIGRGNKKELYERLKDRRETGRREDNGRKGSVKIAEGKRMDKRQ